MSPKWRNPQHDRFELTMWEELSFDGREADRAPFLFDAVINHDGDHCGEKIQQYRTGGLHHAAIELAAFRAGTMEDLDTHHVQPFEQEL